MCIFGICRYSHKRSFFDILNTQESFLDQNSKVKKKISKNRKFAMKELAYGFCQKIDLFLICLFSGYLATKDCFLIVWIESNACYTKIVKFEKSPNTREFACKGLDLSFCQKSTFFSSVFFGICSHKKSFFDILNRKQCFLDRRRKV